MLKIVVDTPEEKETLIEESKLMHDVVPYDGCPILSHIWASPHLIEVKKANTRYDAGGA
jgi:hypothetical protein